MSAIESCCAPNQRPTMSTPITAWARPWRIFLHCARSSTESSTAIWTCSKDILETFVDREELHRLTQPTLLPNGRRIPGLKLEQPRQLALMHSLVRFCYLAAEGTFHPRLIPANPPALRKAPEEYKLGSLRYDLWKLRAKGLVEKIPHSRGYRLLLHGYQICLVFLKVYEKIYAPLTASILQPFAADQSIPRAKITALDRRYAAIIQALDGNNGNNGTNTGFTRGWLNPNAFMLVSMPAPTISPYYTPET